MKQIIALLITSLFSLSHLSAQDKNAVAITYYTKAEEFYNQGTKNGFDNCVSELEKAEKELDGTNSKILYLKIKALGENFKTSNSYYQKLKSSLTDFFKITDDKIYPSDKYSEIIKLQSETEEFIKQDSLKSDNLINFGNLSQIQNYLNNAPNTFYYTKLNTKRQQLQKDADKLAVDSRLKGIEIELPKAKAKDTRRRVLGAIFLAAGGTAAYYGFSQPGAFETGGENWYYGYGGMVGAGLGIFGLVKLIGGNHKEIQRLKNEQNELLQRKKTLVFSAEPYFKKVYASNTFGLNIKLNF